METIFISDLDGTLVNNEAELSEYSLTNLKSLIADGLPFTVASARSIVSIQQMLKGLHLPLPVISFNGAYLSDLETGKHKIINSINSDAANSIFECFPRHNCVPYISTYTGIEERVYYNSVINEGMQWYLEERIARKDPRFRRTENLRNSLSEQVVCMTLIDRKEVLDDLEKELLEKHGDHIEVHNFENQYSPGWYWLTIHDVRASKDQAIQTLKEFCGIEKSKVVVFGDNKNDLKMFQKANHAVAVKNATNEIKSHAHEIIGSNQDDSVVNYLLDKWR